jgi:adenine-specific DNA glycosylase
MFSAKLAIPKMHEFLLKWPTPEDVMKANTQDLLCSMENLGLENTRVKTIKGFTGKFERKIIIFCFSKLIYFYS